MKIQVLVAAMHQNDHSLLEKMHLKTDAIIANQCENNSIEDFEWNGNHIRYLNFAERGVGLNRNNALMRATGDVCLFADDDMVYEDDYVEKVERSFKQYPDADVIIFNLIEPSVTRYVIKKPYKVGLLNYLRFGTARVAVRLRSIREKGIFFNLCFGGGTEHRHGEDNIFLTDCLNNGLKMYAVPEYIATLTEERASTWDIAYDDKYFLDQGALYKKISPKLWKLLCLQDAVRHRRLYNKSWLESLRKMIK